MLYVAAQEKIPVTGEEQSGQSLYMNAHPLYAPGHRKVRDH